MLYKIKPDATSCSFDALVFCGNKSLDSCFIKLSCDALSTSNGIAWRQISFSSIATVSSSSIIPGKSHGVIQPCPTNLLLVLFLSQSGAGKHNLSVSSGLK